MTDADLRAHGYAPGDYSARCYGCEAGFVGARGSLRCRPCAEALHRAKGDAEWLAWRDRNREAADALIAGTAAVVPMEATEAMRNAYMRASITYANPEWTCADIIAAGRLDRGGDNG